MNYSQTDAIVGMPQVSFGGSSWDSPTPRIQPGLIIKAVDNWWGAGEFIYAKATAAIRAFGLITLLPVFDATLNSYRYDATEAANTANLGFMLGVSTGAVVSGNYSWFQIGGLVPVNSIATVVAGTALGIAAAGQAGANSAGKQILNARVAAAASTTVVKTNCATQGLSNQLRVQNADGWFAGAYLSGTGVAAGATVASISSDGLVVTMSAASTAPINGSVTATYNNGTIFYNVTHLNRPFAQGAIT